MIVNARTPHWLRKLREAQEIARRAYLEADDKQKIALLEKALDGMQEATLEAVENGSGWYRQALEEYRQFKGRNKGRGGVTTKQKIDFLRGFVADDPEPETLSIAALSKKVATEFTDQARDYWLEEDFLDLETAIRNFANRKANRAAIFGEPKQ